MSGKSYTPDGDDIHPHDHSRAETGERAPDLDAEDPFEDEAVTSVIDAAWDDLTS